MVPKRTRVDAPRDSTISTRAPSGSGRGAGHAMPAEIGGSRACGPRPPLPGGSSGRGGRRGSSRPPPPGRGRPPTPPPHRRCASAGGAPAAREEARRERRREQRPPSPTTPPRAAARPACARASDPDRPRRARPPAGAAARSRRGPRRARARRRRVSLGSRDRSRASSKPCAARPRSPGHLGADAHAHRVREAPVVARDGVDDPVVREASRTHAIASPARPSCSAFVADAKSAVASSSARARADATPSDETRGARSESTRRASASFILSSPCPGWRPALGSSDRARRDDVRRVGREARGLAFAQELGDAAPPRRARPRRARADRRPLRPRPRARSRRRARSWPPRARARSRRPPGARPCPRRRRGRARRAP